MPTKSQVRANIAAVTPESFSSMVVLNKTNYKEHEANLITLQAVISYHALLLVDEVLSQLTAGPTNISRETYQDIMRTSWQANADLRTAAQQMMFIDVASYLTKTSIGRNQAIKQLLESTIKCLPSM